MKKFLCLCGFPLLLTIYLAFCLYLAIERQMSGLGIFSLVIGLMFFCITYYVILFAVDFGSGNCSKMISDQHITESLLKCFMVFLVPLCTLVVRTIISSNEKLTDDQKNKFDEELSVIKKEMAAISDPNKDLVNKISKPAPIPTPNKDKPRMG